MKRIGLTGNIGTGKSTVAGIFEILGVPVYHADKRSRDFLDSGDVKEQISSMFGKHLINPIQKVDRRALAEIVFSDKAKLSTLNAILHPLIEEDFNQWCTSHQDQDYILQEAAILFESGFGRLFEATILVTAPDEVCIARVMKRDNVRREMVMDRMRNQWPQEEKQKLADYEILNDEKTMVIPQVLAIHQSLKKDNR
jgi:dephospho-CoA kinase